MHRRSVPIFDHDRLPLILFVKKWLDERNDYDQIDWLPVSTVYKTPKRCTVSDTASRFRVFLRMVYFRLNERHVSQLLKLIASKVWGIRRWGQVLLLLWGVRSSSLKINKRNLKAVSGESPPPPATPSPDQSGPIVPLAKRFYILYSLQNVVGRVSGAVPRAIRVG